MEQSRALAIAILAEAIQYLKGNEVVNPMRLEGGFDCDAMAEAAKAIEKVTSI